MEPEKQLLFGEDVPSNPVPEHTAQCTDRLYAAFQDAAGRAFALNTSRLSKHLLLLGGVGSGKTNVFNFLVEALLARQAPEDILFIFDTKGDFYDTFFQPDNPGHIVIGNSPRYASVTRSWNIFGELEEPEGGFTAAGAFTAKEIAKQLFVGRESETQPFFSMAAADLVSKILIDFVRRAQRGEVPRPLNTPQLVEWLDRANLASYMELLGRNPDFASAQLYFGDPGQGVHQKLTPQALGVFGYINAMRSDLFTGIFAGESPNGTFSMRNLVRSRGRGGRPAVVFIEYDLGTGEVLAPIYRLLIDLALKEALSQSGRGPGSVMFVIDEFKLLPQLMHIDDALNFGRGLGVKVFAGIQSVDQVYAGYGEERGRALLSGFMNCFCFQTPDYSSRQYITQRFGENCVQLLYQARNESLSYQREGHALEDWDVLNLKVGQAAVDLAGEKPFLFQFPEFRQKRQNGAYQFM